jgi:hypothetical protein
MGFFKSVTGLLGGGGGGSTSSTQGGFSTLPPEIQSAYTTFADQVKNQLTSGNLSQAYRPMDLNAGEKTALANTYQGFAPTAQTLQSDIAMQQNPFDQYVIDAINRESQGANSILGQNLTRAGQMGSNRQMLGANDIDLTRLQQIGQFKQGNYQQALQNALNVLPASRRQDAAGSLGAGTYERQLGLQQQTAPVTALQQIGSALGVLPTASGSSTTNTSQDGSPLKAIGNLASIGSAIFSDARLKKDIIEIGEKNGHKLYEFSYIPKVKKSGRFIGVMAQDVEKYMPEAVTEIEGFKAVNYSMLGLEMMEAA